MKPTKPTRHEYPRPQFRRDEWMPLNGEWDFCFDDGSIPPDRSAYDRKINVPFTYEYEASGIEESARKTRHSSVWYTRTFETDKAFKDKRVLLCFNGCDYVTDVWVNGKHVVTHVGGFSPFNADITEFLESDGVNTLTVHCVDPLDPDIPRGKQSWLFEPFGCWYTPNTGIWQSVWLELFGADCIDRYTVEPDIDACCFSGEITTLYGVADSAEIALSFRGKPFKTVMFSLDGKHTRYCVKLKEENFVDETMFWAPEHPNLFYADFKLFKDGKQVDLAHTRIGLRKISVDEGGRICLNNRPLYQRLILDQGYWRESGLTPPSADALKTDIELAMAMGFNGARKHQKSEDPYFYYYADELGFLTWCEMPSAFDFTSREVAAQSAEWQEVIAANRNFASVIGYVPLNESWGVRKILNDKKQQNYARAMYYITRSLDGTRLISTNDGWENLDTTDVVTVHDYAFDSSAFAQKYEPQNLATLYPASRKLTVEGCEYSGQPVLLSEFGGIAFKNASHDGNWGYNEGASDDKEFLSRLKNLMDGIYKCNFQGFCYTQLTDVQQEVNGLLFADRTPKLDIKELYKIFKN